MMKRLTITAIAGLLLAAAAAPAQTTAEAAAVRRFARAFLTYVPDSAYEVRLDHQGSTVSGGYQAYTVIRSVADDKNTEQIAVLLDETTRTVTAGLVAPLPATDPPVTPENLPRFVSGGLPQVLAQVFPTVKVRVRWPGSPARPTAIVPLTIDVSTGYGWAHMPLAITADGKYMALGSAWSLDRDPREARREMIDPILVQWDPEHQGAAVTVVEFSDYECPACKRGWGEMKPALAQLGDKVRHGIVNFPLVSNHPWAFRAAVAGSCIARLWPDKLLAFKEEMYRLQDTMTVATVDEAAFGFLDQQALDKAAFLGCHMKDPAIDRVLEQMTLGHRLGVLGTPAYYANGELLPFGKREVVIARLQAIVDAGGKPENAAEVRLPPSTPAPAKPTPAAAPHP
jgi:protein-disulfide isomerase